MWKNVLTENLKFSVLTNIYPTLGKLVYEYNPLRNYRLQSNKYYFRGGYYTLEELKENFLVTPSSDKLSWEGVPDTETSPELYEKGLLVDFITDELSFSLENPAHIVPLYSYDGSVNLIINDGINIPRLINSRFSATGRNTYLIVDRKGNNDTNIYDLGDLFDIDTSLYKRVVKIPKITFLNVQSGGNLKVGNYHFYFKLADADGNETDFVGESGLVSVFIGFGNPKAVHTGTKNENSLKAVKFQIRDIDTSYDYVHVYYSRSSAEGSDNFLTLYAKVEKRFVVNAVSEATILITGFEETTELNAADINLDYNLADAVTTSAVCLNILFLGNVHKPEIPYNKLLDLSLRFLPYVKEVPYILDMDLNYNITSSSSGYYDEKFIYNNVGYWNNEFYRLGIVYILPNNELSPVFNIRGRHSVKPFLANSSKLFNDGLYNHYNIRDKNGDDITIKILETTNYLIPPDEGEGTSASIDPSFYENAKGVVSFKSLKDTNTIYALDVRVDDDTLQELKKYIKGYFFVRLTRIPTILALGVTIGIDKESHTPTVPTAKGFLTELADSLENTYVETEDINDVNYISEGFLSRYSFDVVAKSSSIWKKIGGAILKVGLITALAVGASLVFPPAAAILGAIAVKVNLGVGFYAAGALAVGASGIIGGAVAATTMGAIATVDELANVIKRTTSTVKLKGRNTSIPGGYKRKEKGTSRQLTQDFISRVIIKDKNSNNIEAMLCPDYEVNLAYYNQIFTGNEHILRSTISQNINVLSGYSSSFFENSERHFYVPSYFDSKSVSQYTCRVIPVQDNSKFAGIDNYKFRSRAGEGEEAFRYECVSEDYKSDKSKGTSGEDSETISNKRINTDIVRGSFGPYLGITNYPKFPCTTVDILIPGYSESKVAEYMEIRMKDNSVFCAISDRFDILESDDFLINLLSNISGSEDRSCGYSWDLYRGDCYICLFTHRVNRNFNDPSAPYNDEIVDENTWKDNYDPDKTEKYENINLGDVNAVKLGMWVTFRVRSSNNLNIRTLDGSNVDEVAMTGHLYGYYPYQDMSTEGTYKHPESQIYNKGFTKSLSERWNFELPDVPYIKNWFGTRIMYSDIHINDAYKNGFRVFQGTHYRDYTREYGEIVKLISLESNLLCVFEHGVALIPVNERAIAGEGSGGNVYINTSNVLPESPKIISDMFGSQWPESVLKVPGNTGDSAQYVYGVDTVAKKIWRTDGNTITCISDFKCQEFLNNNITLGERELTPKIGIRNVKTVYNAFKRDVLFTFYDNTYGFEEKVWNLCWNELLLKFITFYSWVPSYMENINNIPFSFDRNTSKWVAKLGTSHTENSFADGITLSNVVINNDVDEKGYVVSNFSIPVSYVNKLGQWVTKRYKLINEEDKRKFVGLLSLSNRVLPDSLIHYRTTFLLERDIHGNYKKFDIKGLTVKNEEGYEVSGGMMLPADAMFAGSFMPLQALFFREGDDEYLPVYYKNGNDIFEVFDSAGNPIYWYEALNTPKALLSEMYYRNKAGHAYADYDDNKIRYTKGDMDSIMDLPIFKDITGKRVNLPREEMLNPDKLVTMLNIKAIISIVDEDNQTKLGNTYYNMKAGFTPNTSLVGAGYYESVVAITPKWNLQFLSTDFWKHGQAGLIDIADDIYPTYWYGKQHPFEFECVIVNDPSIHKVFTNLELVANKAKPESFHYEIIGEAYDFAKDKANMYFRLEAMKALWQYNGADISYNRNFLKILPRQLPKSADFPHKYYTRLDTINEIEDYYIHVTYPSSYNYNHLSGAEIVYYPNRLEYRIRNHVKAVSIDDLLDTTNLWKKNRIENLEDNIDRTYKNSNSYSGGRSIIGVNCLYLEDRWKVTINPILVCYKNEYLGKYSGSLILPQNSTWAKAKDSSQMLPTLPIYNSPIPDLVLEEGKIDFPGNDPEHPEWGKDNALYNLYDLSNYNDRGNWKPLDLTNWLDDVNVYKYNFGEALNRKEVDIRDKFVKIRIRYSGEELAVIDFLNTIYRISYS